jgi:hypothetical protein
VVCVAPVKVEEAVTCGSSMRLTTTSLSGSLRSWREKQMWSRAPAST